MKPIKIIIFEDNDDMREGLVWLVHNHAELELLAAYPDANAVKNIMQNFTPDIVLMDIQMPGISGIEAMKIIKALKNDVHVVILTAFDDEDNIFAAIRGGASGYLLKTNVSSEIVPAIKEVLAGGSPMNARVARKVMLYFQEQPKTTKPDYRLTLREKEILARIVEGDSNKMIAQLLFISEQTVPNHIRHIYEKLQVNSRAEAVTKTLRNKIL